MKKLLLSTALAATTLCANAQTDYSIQTACNPLDVKTYDTDRLRSAFTMQNVMEQTRSTSHIQCTTVSFSEEQCQ